MKCYCRNCRKVYDDQKSRADYTGFCSAKCLHEKAKQLGYRKGGTGYYSEYEILSRRKCIGNVPTEEERVKLRAELKELSSSTYGSPIRMNHIRRLLATKV